MSGMDRLIEEYVLPNAELEVYAYGGGQGPMAVMARELLAHRRASQTAIAPDDQFVTTLPQEAFDAFAKACEDAPAPSDGTCAKCGCAPTNAAGLCATCVDERAPAPYDGLREAIERAAVVAECAFDDRPRDRSGHPSHMDWEDGYREGTRAAAEAIRAALTPAPAQEGGE